MPSVEFSYNNYYQSAIVMVQYEARYGRKYRSPIHKEEAGKRKYMGLELVEHDTEEI